MKWFWVPEDLWSTSRDTPSESGVGLRVYEPPGLRFALFLSGPLGDGVLDLDPEEDLEYDHERLELPRLVLRDF